MIVVEPTVSGLHDMSRVADLAVHFKIPGLICVNKYDLNTEMTMEIEAFAQKRNMKVVGRVPFDPRFTKAMIQGKNILEFQGNSDTADTVREVWDAIMQSPSMNLMGLRDFSAVIK